jgi:two-component system sensor histidine kinase TctE
LQRTAEALTRTDDDDHIYFQVLGSRGELLAGDAALAVPADESQAEPGVRFRDDMMGDEPVRVAYLWLEGPAGACPTSTATRWCRWPKRWASARNWPPRSSRA